MATTLSEDDQIALAQRYAPIMWLHENEAFIPEDCTRISRISRLHKKDKCIQEENFDFNRIIEIAGQSKDFHFRMEGIDIPDYSKPPTSGVYNSPNEIIRSARQKYGHDFQNANSPGVAFPKYYARASQQRFGPFVGSRRPEDYDGIDNELFGDYFLIEYFFYFIFNDAWNLHQSDWDSKIEIWVNRNEGNKRVFMVNHFHHSKSVTEIVDCTAITVDSWVNEWQASVKNKLNKAYSIDSLNPRRHPFVFIAQGAHGGYPTPGFTVFGFDVPHIPGIPITVDDLLTNTDERQIGHKCILPEGVTGARVTQVLRDSQLKSDRLQFANWKKPEIIIDQPWVRYKGKWGQNTKYQGWDGPSSPPFTRKPGPENFIQALKNNFKGGTILGNVHKIDSDMFLNDNRNTVD